jgi:hypothetical protein
VGKEKMNDAEAHTLMEIAMAATYDPDPARRSGFRLPSTSTPARSSARWARWREHDPSTSSRATRAPAIAARHLRRLRLARPVPPALRRAHPLARAREARHRAHLRGVRRHAFVDRLPHGREPAVPLPRAQALKGSP